MVNPLAASITSMAITSGPVHTERPANVPEPAQEVTAANETIGSGSATDANKDGSLSQPLNPLERALEELNNSMKAWSTGMRFDVDPDAERVVISIVDSATGEVLRTVPSEAVIRVAKMIVQLQGQSISTKA